jgi:hypothetical protein
MAHTLTSNQRSIAIEAAKRTQKDTIELTPAQREILNLMLRKERG